MRRFWRDFKAAFWRGYEQAMRRQAPPEPPDRCDRCGAGLVRRRDQYAFRALCHECWQLEDGEIAAQRRLREAMTKYGISDRDRRPQAGRES